MSDYPCQECGHEGRGIGAHSLRCSRQRYSGDVCQCGESYLLKSQWLCEDCSKDPLEEFWKATDRSVFNLTRVAPAQRGRHYEEYEKIDPSAP